MTLKNLISDHYEHYLDFLRNLVSMPSEFTKPGDVKKAIEYCKKVFEENLSDYFIYFDEENNLIALPPDIDTRKEMIYLSAHIDTVGAKEDEWTPPYNPWKLYENEKELVARGVNDCKAGVAYQLFLSFLSKKGLIQISNIIFTITFKEEGAGHKSSKAIGKELGKKLPLSKTSTYLMVLENNVRVQERPILCIYTSEKTNYVIKITDFIPELQNHLRNLTHWNPVSIHPEKQPENLNYQTIEQVGGHVCSVNREQNKLTEIILKADKHTVIKAGGEENFAVVPTQILSAKTDKPIKHSLIINNRSFDSLKDILNQLDGMGYEIMKDFSISQGFNIEEKFSENKLLKALKKVQHDSEVELEWTHNVGASDGTIIYGTLDSDLRDNFYPIVMGPGCRSQRNASPTRLIHGKNETFDKKSGEKAVAFISKALEKMNFLKILS